MTHSLKILPKYYDDVLNGRKKFEIRKNDRNFKVGDKLLLQEWDKDEYTGREMLKEVDYIFPSNGTCELSEDYCITYGLSEGYCILGLTTEKPAAGVHNEEIKNTIVVLLDAIRIAAISINDYSTSDEDKQTANTLNALVDIVLKMNCLLRNEE